MRRQDVKNGFTLGTRLRVLLLAVLTAIIVLPLCSYTQERGPSPGGEPSADVARGKYLVESVAMCGQCHTPRDENGVLVRSQWLQGGAVPFMPAQARANWPLLAPRIGGMPPASDADMIKLLTTGIWTNGQQLRFPMMPFRMNDADAKAVIAYLKTPSAWN
ncbi:MAG TPA: cytochrome c [Terriglobales bacterium]|nr:cytochrome c [Terriglobales bacterium]